MDIKITTTEHIVNDPEIRAVKDKMMRSLRWNSVLNSINRATALIAGPVVASGAIAGLSIAVAKMAELGFMGALAAGFTMPVLATLAVGAIFAAVSIGSDYLASRIWQSKQFDNLEVNAQSTAHHLVQELKGNNMCLVEDKQQARTDGKSWEQFVSERNAAAALQNQQLH